MALTESLYSILLQLSRADFDFQHSVFTVPGKTAAPHQLTSQSG
ncbi:hypothetical protein HMPREF0239_03391 [Clostridium sp. ATCC BAA-442]|nr:hypothetical protein HMPREF0239_03391 [Clostridium sp. ATCC BAA-442]